MQDLFLFFALSALWLFSALGLQELILTSSQEAVKQHNCLPFAFPKRPSNLVRMGNYSTMLMDTLSPIKLEFDIFGLVQMLLVMSGIETNPGPATGTNSSCCNTSQHFNRVKRVIADAQSNFRTKVSADTLTKPAIDIHEAGEWKHCIAERKK